MKPLARLFKACETLSPACVAAALNALTEKQKEQCWAQPDILVHLMGAMQVNCQAAGWVPALEVVAMLVEAGAPVPPSNTQGNSPLQVATSPTWLPFDAQYSALSQAEEDVAAWSLRTVIKAMPAAQLPTEGLDFEQWSQLEPLARMLQCHACHALAQRLVEEGVVPAWVTRPSGARLAQWPECPTADLWEVAHVDVQARLWTHALGRGFRLPTVFRRAPALHFFCGMDLRLGAPVLKAALLAGYDPRAKNAEGQSALEHAIGLVASNPQDWAALLAHDLTLLDVASSDGRTVYACLMEAFAGPAIEEATGASLEAQPSLMNLRQRVLAYRSSVDLLDAGHVEPGSTLVAPQRHLEQAAGDLVVACLFGRDAGNCAAYRVRTCESAGICSLYRRYAVRHRHVAVLGTADAVDSDGNHGHSPGCLDEGLGVGHRNASHSFNGHRCLADRSVAH